MGRLDGKATIVTGSGRGLGRAYAMHMAREGARIIVNDVDAEEAETTVADIKAEGGEAVVDGESVADWDGARRLIDHCVGEFGRIDVLVSNAGVHHETEFKDETEREIDFLLGVNLKGTMNANRHALERMVPQRQGCIINVSSGSQSGTGIGTSVYAASKAGVAGFTYALAMEVAKYNIRVNALSPMARTRMGANRAGDNRAPWSPDNVAPLAVFLASEDAWYVTGQVVRLEGTVLSLLSHPRIVHPAVHATGWTVEEISKSFKDTVGSNLQPVGLRAARYEYYDGLDKGPAV